MVADWVVGAPPVAPVVTSTAAESGGPPMMPWVSTDAPLMAPADATWGATDGCWLTTEAIAVLSMAQVLLRETVSGRRGPGPKAPAARIRSGPGDGVQDGHARIMPHGEVVLLDHPDQRDVASEGRDQRAALEVGGLARGVDGHGRGLADHGVG